MILTLSPTVKPSLFSLVSPAFMLLSALSITTSPTLTLSNLTSFAVETVKVFPSEPVAFLTTIFSPATTSVLFAVIFFCKFSVANLS